MKSIKNTIFAFSLLSIMGCAFNIHSMSHRSLTPRTTALQSSPFLEKSQTPNSLLKKVTIRREDFAIRPTPSPSFTLSDGRIVETERDWLDDRIESAVTTAVDRVVERLEDKILPPIQAQAVRTIQEAVYPIIPTPDDIHNTITHTAQTAQDSTVTATRAIAPHVSQLTVGGVVATAWGIGGALTAYNALNDPNSSLSRSVFRFGAGLGMTAGSMAAYSRYADYITRKHEARDAERKTT